MSGIPAYGTGRRDLTRLDEQRAAAPETTPGQAAKSCVSVEATQLNETETGWVEAGIFIDRAGEDELAQQMLLASPDELRAVYDGLKLHYEQGIWSFRTVERSALAAQERPAPEPGPHRHAFAAADCACDPSCECWQRSLAPQPAPVLATAWRLLDEARARLAVTAAERNDLRQALDERNRQLDAFTHEVIGLDDGARLVGIDRLARKAHAVRKEGGLPVIDQFSKPADGAVSAYVADEAASGAAERAKEDTP